MPDPAVCLEQGLLRRVIRINRPVSCLVEYRADRLNDQVWVDGQLMVSRLAIFWFHKKLEFCKPYDGREYRFQLRVKVGHFLRIKRFQIWIDEVCVYCEPTDSLHDGHLRIEQPAS